jgi:hypothetical protein
VSRKPERIAKNLTRAQRQALTTALRFEDDRVFAGRWFPRLAVRMDVRRALMVKGLLSVRPGHFLTKLGERVRDCLL